MTQDHLRLDGLFLEAGQLLRDRDPGALDQIRAFTAALRLHLELEEQALIPAFPRIINPGNEDPVQIMQREHEAILTQLRIIDGLTQEPTIDLEEAGVWMDLLGASLAKHEFREETQIFPQWDLILARSPGRALLSRRLARRLTGLR